MKNIFIILLLTLSTALFAEGSVSFQVSNNRVSATIELSQGESIRLSEESLYLFIDSDKYDFIFDGYPQGKMLESGTIIYTDFITLEGELFVKSDTESDSNEIDIILGYQTINSDGTTNMLIEITETMVLSEKFSILPFIIITAIFLILILIVIKKRKIFNGK